MHLLTFRQYVDFIFKYHYKKDFHWAYHHELIADALQNVLLGKTKRLIINVPPRYGKSELLKLFIAYGMTYYPRAQNIYTSYSANLAINMTYSIRNILIDEHTTVLNENCILKQDAKAKGYFLTEAGGHCLGVGAGGSITGFGAGVAGYDKWGGCIAIDDPIKPTEANSDTVRENINEWYNDTLQSRINNRNTPIILIMQRLHEDDLSGFLLAGGSGEEWEHLKIPALLPDGTALWEEKHTVEDLKRIERASPYVFAGQYLQEPAPLGGGILKKEWLKFIDRKDLPHFDWVFIAVDTANKTKTMNDYTVFGAFGVSGNNLFLFDMVRDKMEAPELLARAKDFYRKHDINYGRGARLRAMYIEDKQNGTALIQFMKQEGFIVVDVQRNIDKVTRAMDTAPQLELGRVYVVNDTPHIEDLISEMVQFPNASHDDTVDVLMDGVQIGLNSAMTDFALEGLLGA